ncbi:MAG: response regulator transcription factor, partial [Candidatus Rokubacteria bacterium]|nr:response regulator transcription factor [Candidatus Rokubacteria bacterium]
MQNRAYILIIDDDLSVAETLQKLLKVAGYAAEV